MKIEKVSNLAVTVFVPYSITILVETQKDADILGTAASRLVTSIYPDVVKMGTELRQVLQGI